MSIKMSLDIFTLKLIHNVKFLSEIRGVKVSYEAKLYYHLIFVAADYRRL